MVWGDDFTFLGRDFDLKWVAGVMTARYEIKVWAVLGPESHDDKEVRILNRKVRWEVSQILNQGDEKHVHTIILEMGLQRDSRFLDSPVVQEAENVTEGDERDHREASRYRHLAAIVNYLSMDRLDVQVEASVLCRAMSRPTVQCMVALKRVARYLLKHPSMEFEHSRTSIEEASVMEGYSDSDWAGCRATRRNVSGGIVTLGGCALKSWSNGQGSVALSSGEAEYYASVKAAAELIGLRSLAKDLGWNVGLQLKIDSSAPKAVTSPGWVLESQSQTP